MQSLEDFAVTRATHPQIPVPRAAFRIVVLTRTRRLPSGMVRAGQLTPPPPPFFRAMIAFVVRKSHQNKSNQSFHFPIPPPPPPPTCSTPPPNQTPTMYRLRYHRRRFTPFPVILQSSKLHSTARNIHFLATRRVASLGSQKRPPYCYCCDVTDVAVAAEYRSTNCTSLLLLL